MNYIIINIYIGNIYIIFKFSTLYCFSDFKDFIKRNNLYKVIGIREIKDFIDKKTSLKEMKLNIVIKTRQYAKRQRTWSRGQMNDWQKFDPKELSKFIKKL